MAELLSPDHVLYSLKDDLTHDLKEPKEELEEGPKEIIEVSPITPTPLLDSSSYSNSKALVTTKRTVWMPPSGSIFEVGGPSFVSSLPPHLLGREDKRLREDTKSIYGSVKVLERDIRTYQTEIAATCFGVAMMFPNLVTPERKKIKRYVRGLSQRVKGNVNSSKPSNIHEAINMARELVEQAVRAKAIRVGESNNRKQEEHLRNNSSATTTPTTTSKIEDKKLQKLMWHPHLRVEVMLEICHGATDASCTIMVNVLINAESVRGVITEINAPGRRINKMKVLVEEHIIIFDSGVEKSFVSTTFTPFIDIAPIALNTSDEVELADGKSIMAELLSPDHVLYSLKDDLTHDLKEPKEELEEGPKEIIEVSPITPTPLLDSSSYSNSKALVTTKRTVWMPPSGSIFEVGGPSFVSSLPPHLLGREDKSKRDATGTSDQVLALQEENRRLRRRVDSLEANAGNDRGAGPENARGAGPANTRGSGPENARGATAPEVQRCPYKTFLNCKPHSFNETYGVV
nr:hypothetical protein [Tanacetum cinerariifolium]